MGDTGEPTGVPKISLKYFPRNVNYDGCLQRSRPSQTSCIDQLTRSWKSSHSFNLLLAISTAIFVGTFVNNYTTSNSKHSKISSSSGRKSLMELTKSLELRT